MRVPRLVISAFLFLPASTAAAQDLQYRIRMQVSAPQRPAMQPFESAMYIKGTSIRADNRTSGYSSSVIVDAAAGKLYAINHEERSYQEIPTDLAADSTLMSGDTARLRALGLVPEVTRTGEKKTILGYPATRIISVQNQPFPGEAGAQAVMISDSWVTQDPKLMRAFAASMTAAQKLMGSSAQSIMSLLPPEANGLPLATTTVMVKRTGHETVDALAILRDANPPGLLMRSELTATEVKLLILPDSLFRVPQNYKKVD
jgi:hypothetical protein